MQKHSRHEADTMIHGMNVSPHTPRPVVIILLVFALVLGSVTGFFASRVLANPLTGTTAGSAIPSNETEKAADRTVRAAGIKDAKVFKDTAEGTLREGGFEDEGSYHLERPGGKSQNVYLTSSTVDLSQFVGKKVSVMGKTFAAEKAGWLMDVGYIEVK